MPKRNKPDESHLSTGGKIALRRKECGLTQVELAKLAGVTQPTISDLENDKQEIEIPTLNKLVAGFNKSKVVHESGRKKVLLHDLIGLSTPKPTPQFIEPLPCEPEPQLLPVNLKPKPALCVGRDEQLAKLNKLYVEATGDLPNTPVIGIGGSAKTTTVLWFLHSPAVEKKYKANRHFVPLETADTKEKLLLAIKEYLNIPTGPNLEDDIVRFLERGEARLLVLDNAETPLNASGKAEKASIQLFLSTLTTIAQVGLIATLRPDDALGRGWSEPIECKPLGKDKAAELFREHAGKDKFQNDPDLDRFVKVLGGWGILIQLAGMCCRDYHTVREFEGVWDRRKQELFNEPGDKTRPDQRVVNITVCVSLSLDRLDADGPGRRLLALLTVLPNGIAVEDRKAILPDDGVDGDAELRRVGGLAEVNVADKRLTLLPPLREYLSRQLTPSDEDRDRATRHFADLAAGLIDYKVMNRDRLRVRPNYGNCEWAAETALQMGDTFLAARMKFGLGQLCWLESTLATAAKLFEDARQLFKFTDRWDGVANCVKCLADVAFTKSEYAMASTQYSEARQLFENASNPHGVANCVERLGDVLLANSEIVLATSQYSEAIRLHKSARNPLGVANCVKGLGDIALRNRELPTAEQHYANACDLYESSIDTLGVTNCIRSLGDVALTKYDFPVAEKQYAEAQLRYESGGNPLGVANCVLGIGEVRRRVRKPSDARALFASALETYERIGTRLGVGAVRWCLVRVAESDKQRRGHAEAARTAWAGLTRPWQNFPELFDGDPDDHNQSSTG